VVGRYEGGKVTAAELQHEANRLPPALRQQFETQAGRREMVAAMIDKRILVREAERRKLRDDPEVRRQVRELEERLMVQALLSAEERGAGAASEAEARAFYEAHKGELAQPERVRVSRILAAVQPDASQAERARARARLEKLAARVRAGAAFAAVAAEGNGPERTRGGDLGLLTKGGAADRRLGEAAFKLAKEGEPSPILACADGYAVLQLTERRAGRVPSFEEARSEVENRLGPSRKRKVFDALIARLRANAKTSVEIAAGPR
jgi:peptidyl-prolyl cis-trans isomerase C